MLDRQRSVSSEVFDLGPVTKLEFEAKIQESPSEEMIAVCIENLLNTD